MHMTASDGGPYVGRRAFELDDHDFFFGRDEEIRQVRTLWRSSPLLVLHGLAGSGKTSFLQAGVAPQLAEDDDEVFPLGRALGSSSFPEPLLDDHNPYSLAVLASWSPSESRARLAHESVTGFLNRRAQSRWSRRGKSLLLVAIDQIEEILVDERAGRSRDRFFADLATAIDEIPVLRMLLVIRTDALSELSQYEKQLYGVGATYFRLESLTAEDAIEAIRNPMERAGGRFAVGAAEYLVGKLNGSPKNIINQSSEIQPAELQVVCAELWHITGTDQPLITANFIRYNIGIHRILATFCANVIMEVADQHQISTDQVFNWLAQGFLVSDSNLVKMSEAKLTATGIPVGLLRMLENEHLLIAERVPGAKVYRLASHHLADALRYLGKSPVLGQLKLDFASRMQVAESTLAQGELTLAQYHAEDALKSLNPVEIRWRADILSFLGNIEYRAGRTDIAVKNYWDAAGLHEQLGDQPGAGRLFGAIGCIHANQGEYLKALEELQLAVARSPSELTLQTELATALWRSGQSQAAVAVFGAVLAVEPESAEALSGRGQIRAERGNASAALDDLQALRRLRPSVSLLPEVQSAYALALAFNGLSETAMAEADAALASASDSAVIFVRAARVALASGAVKRAKELLQQAEAASHPSLSSHQRARVRRLLAEAGEPGSAPRSASGLWQTWEPRGTRLPPPG